MNNFWFGVLASSWVQFLRKTNLDFDIHNSWIEKPSKNHMWRKVFSCEKWSYSVDIKCICPFYCVQQIYECHVKESSWNVMFWRLTVSFLIGHSILKWSKIISFSWIGRIYVLLQLYNDFHYVKQNLACHITYVLDCLFKRFHLPTYILKSFVTNYELQITSSFCNRGQSIFRLFQTLLCPHILPGGIKKERK